VFLAGEMSSEWGSEREKEAAAEQELGEEAVQKVNLTVELHLTMKPLSAASSPTFSSSSFLPLTYDEHALLMLYGTAAAFSDPPSI